MEHRIGHRSTLGRRTDGRPAERSVDVVHPIRFHGAELSRLTAALAALLERRDPGGSFVIWLQDAD
jgi:hypothetical protein